MALPAFQVNSPIRGEAAADETRLSFQSVVVDAVARRMTVREALWNTNPETPSIVWGLSATLEF